MNHAELRTPKCSTEAANIISDFYKKQSGSQAIEAKSHVQDRGRATAISIVEGCKIMLDPRSMKGLEEMLSLIKMDISVMKNTQEAEG